MGPLSQSLDGDSGSDVGVSGRTETGTGTSRPSGSKKDRRVYIGHGCVGTVVWVDLSGVVEEDPLWKDVRWDRGRV